ncbi:hypothetical protein Pmani_035686 [Petrolisthes manimaculis]|uniref:Uncharacterized protein n=1 Tax=Petrolisthes manimaculis TaxID=1843537 RepID=A0AAE1NK07_9EUCA|nr:hypothetical protein Pmani_035686 [Petrolisthes manimaculis]
MLMTSRGSLAELQCCQRDGRSSTTYHRGVGRDCVRLMAPDNHTTTTLQPHYNTFNIFTGLKPSIILVVQICLHSLSSYRRNTVILVFEE